MKKVTWLCFSFSPCANAGNWSAAPASNFLKASAETFCQLLRLSSGPWSLTKYLSGPWSPVGTPFLMTRSVIIQYAGMTERSDFQLQTASKLVRSGNPLAMPAILHFNLHREFFAQIAAGTMRIEYRRRTTFLHTRLEGCHYDRI